MIFDLREHSNRLNNLNISICYTGPMWEDGVKGIAEMVRTSLHHDELSNTIAKAIFSVFVEQVTNMLMYSTGKEKFGNDDVDKVPTGAMLLGHKEKTYFIMTGNEIKIHNEKPIREKIDYLNTLDSKELRQYQKEKLREGDDNPDSKGAGLGLIEIARRATAPIEYKFETVNNESTFFSMYVEIGEGENE